MPKKHDMMRSCSICVLFSGATVGIVLLISCPALADEESKKAVAVVKIHLGSGRTDEGALIEETHEKLKLDNILSTVTYSKDRIKSIDRRNMKADAYRMWRGDFWAAKMLEHEDDRVDKRFVNAVGNATKEYKLALLENPHHKTARKKIEGVRTRENEWLKARITDLNDEKEEWKAKTSKLTEEKLSDEDADELKNNTEALRNIRKDAKKYGRRADSMGGDLDELTSALDRELRRESSEIKQLRLELLLSQRGYNTFYNGYIRMHPSTIDRSSPLGRFLSRFGR